MREHGPEMGDEAFVEFTTGLKSAVEIIKTKSEFGNDAIRLYTGEQTIMSEIGAHLKEGEAVAEEVMMVWMGARPEKLTESYLKALFNHKRVDVAGHHSSFIAETMSLPTWEAVEKTDHGEAHGVLTFLASKFYNRNTSFDSNLQKYYEDGVIDDSFSADIIQGNINYTRATLQGFIGLYLGLLPTEAFTDFRFIPQKKTTGGDQPCWLPKTTGAMNINSKGAAASLFP
jgi:hypothetical protein